MGQGGRERGGREGRNAFLRVEYQLKIHNDGINNQFLMISGC